MLTPLFVRRIVLSFLRAFGASLIVLLPGIAQAPNLGAAKGLAVAAIIGAITSGFRAVQHFVEGGVAA